MSKGPFVSRPIVGAVCQSAIFFSFFLFFFSSFLFFPFLLFFFSSDHFSNAPYAPCTTLFFYFLLFTYYGSFAVELVLDTFFSFSFPPFRLFLFLFPFSFSLFSFSFLLFSCTILSSSLLLFFSSSLLLFSLFASLLFFTACALALDGLAIFFTSRKAARSMASCM